MSSDKKDADLAVAARDGDRHAFDELVSRHKEPLFRLARSYIGNSDDAYDVVQEAFVAAWLALSRFDPKRDFATWLRTIALNKCRDFSRRQAVRRRFLSLFAREQALPLQSGAGPTSVEQQALVEERLVRLERAVAELPSFYKEPLLLTLVSGLSHQEAAEQLNTTTKAVEMRTRRARQKVADALKRFYREG